MSFSISAKGTREEALSSLGYQQVCGRLGGQVVTALIDTLRTAPDRLGDSQMIYEIQASGHDDALPGRSVPSLSVSLTASGAALAVAAASPGA